MIFCYRQELLFFKQNTLTNKHVLDFKGFFFNQLKFNRESYHAKETKKHPKW